MSRTDGADNQSENEIWNRLKQFLPVCSSISFIDPSEALCIGVDQED